MWSYRTRGKHLDVEGKPRQGKLALLVAIAMLAVQALPPAAGGTGGLRRLLRHQG